MVVLAITVVMQLEGSFSSSYPPIMENTVRELRAGEGTSAVRYLYRYHKMAINALHGTGTDRKRALFFPNTSTGTAISKRVSATRTLH